jgi:hypothetical protein
MDEETSFAGILKTYGIWILGAIVLTFIVIALIKRFIS